MLLNIIIIVINYNRMYIANFILLLLALITVKADNYCGNTDCYDLLGVSRDADENTIKKAYR
jgi:preprotein translocase subunit Sec63